MWSSTSLQNTILQVPLIQRNPNPRLFSVPLESQLSPPRIATFSGAKQAAAAVVRRSSFLTAAKAPGTKEGAEQQKWTSEGLVTESLPNGMFRVKLDNSDMIIGYICGKIRKSFIRILPGDRVKVEVSRYDSTRGRIIYRLRTSKDQS